MANEFQAALLLRIRCEVDFAVANFQRMLQANEVHMRLGPQTAAPYSDKDLKEAADCIAAAAPDPHQFA